MSKDDVTPAERFFAQRLEQGRGLTFKDVSVLTGRSSGNLEAIDFRGKVSRRVGCKVPLISSPMDTVTGSNMAIAMATCGGLGIIHGSLPPEE